MRSLTLFQLTHFILIIPSCSQISTDVLSKTTQWLESLEIVEYEYNSFHSNMNEKRSAKSYFDFTRDDTLLSARYHFNYKQGEQLYNGNRIVDIDHSNQNVLYIDELSTYHVSSSVFMQNSLLVLRKILPTLLNDDHVKKKYLGDTVISHIPCHLFRLTDIGKALGLGFELRKLDDPSQKRNYLLAVRKDSFQPVLFRQIFGAGSFYQATYTQINEQATRPDSLWTEAYYPSSYKVRSLQEFAESIRGASKKPIEDTTDWHFTTMDDRQIKLSDYKGKLVLFEFWFVGCAPCVKAIPFLNKLREQYDSSEIAIVAVEFQNEKKVVEEYLNRKKFDTKYEILCNGKQSAQQLGINGAPFFLLVDEESNVVYQTLGFDESIKKEIVQNISKRI